MPSGKDVIAEWLVEIKPTGEAEAKAAAEGVADSLEKAKRKSRAFYEEVRRTRAEQEKLSRGMKDGSLAVLERKRRELEKTRREAERYRREMELAERYGRRVGGFLARNEGWMGGAARAGRYAATATVGIGGGMVRSGFSGTVEQNAFNLQWQMASRELAGSFTPAMQIATKAMDTFRRHLESMSRREQTGLMAGGLALGGGLAAHFLSRNLLGVGLGTVAKTGLRHAGAIGLGAVTAYKAADDGYYSMLRREGNNKIVSGLGSIGGGFFDLVSGGEFSEHLRRTGRLKSGKPDANPGRRMVTIADSGFDEVGSAYDRLSNAMAMTAAATPDEKSISEEIRDLLKELVGLTKDKDKPDTKRPGD